MGALPTGNSSVCLPVLGSHYQVSARRPPSQTVYFPFWTLNCSAVFWESFYWSDLTWCSGKDPGRPAQTAESTQFLHRSSSLKTDRHIEGSWKSTEVLGWNGKALQSDRVCLHLWSSEETELCVGLTATTSHICLEALEDLNCLGAENKTGKWKENVIK